MARDPGASDVPAEAEAEASAEPSVDMAPAFDALHVIGELGMDYLVGSAFRFLAEFRDGDELENLQTARTYLDRAIESRGG